MTRPGSNVGRMDRPFRPKLVDIHMANVKHPERKIEPMRRGWSARKAVTFILGLAALCWAVFIVLLWGLS